MLIKLCLHSFILMSFFVFRCPSSKISSYKLLRSPDNHRHSEMSREKGTTYLDQFAGQTQSDWTSARKAFYDLVPSNAAGKSQAAVLMACILDSNTPAELFAQTLDELIMKVKSQDFTWVTAEDCQH